jgi:hypothetical protein
MFIRVENDHTEPQKDRRMEKSKWRGGGNGGGDNERRRRRSDNAFDVSRQGESPSDVGVGSVEYRSDDSFQHSGQVRRQFFNDDASSGDDHSDDGDDDRGSQRSLGDESRLDRSSILSGDDDDQGMSSPGLRQEQLRSSASDNNKLRSVDSTLRDLQGMLDDDNTWN